MRMFKQLFFTKNTETSKLIKRSKFWFFIPGVNSGAYKPTLCVSVLLEKTSASFFSFNKNVLSGEITLSDDEFELLFDEMVKIKSLKNALSKESIDAVKKDLLPTI